MSTPSPVETKLANLLVSLREGAQEANRIADNIEKALLAMYEEQEGATPSQPQVPQFKINSDITALLEGTLKSFNTTAKNITDLRDYAFINVHSASSATVTFTYATASTYTRMCFMTNMLPEVNQILQGGEGIYVVHNSKRKGKNFWDMAVKCEGPEHEILFKAKKLAKLFAELKKEGKL